MTVKANPKTTTREAAILLTATLAVCALYCVPLLRHDEYPLTHQVDDYPLRLLGLWRAMGRGCWDGRWIADFAQGYGYPFFNYYPPGFVYVSALFRLTGLSLTDAVTAATVALSLLGSAGVFVLGWRLWRFPAAGAVAAVVWTYFPYRILNLYVRGDLAELSAMSMMPWALAGHLWVMRGGGRRAIALGAAAHAAIFALHNISALIFQGFLFGFDLLFMAAEGRRARRTWRPLAAAHLLALTVGTAFWLPALADKDLVHIDKMIVPGWVTDVRQQLLWPGQLFRTGWDWGDALPGPEDQLSFQLGWATLGGLALGLAGVIRDARARPARKRRSLGRWAALAILGAVAIGLMLQPSRPFWEHAPLVRFLLFPWRLFMLVALVLALMAGPVGYLLRPLPKWQQWLALALVATLTSMLVWSYLTPRTWMRLSDANLEERLRSQYITTTAYNDYLPRGVKYFTLHRARMKVNGGGLVTISGDVTGVVPLEEESQGVCRRFHVSASSPAVIAWRHFYFPGWRARMDGHPVPIRATAQGLISFALPPGEHEVQFVFVDTPVRWAAKLVSVVGLGALLLILFHRSRKAPDGTQE